jgi:hypothetical protein
MKTVTKNILAIVTVPLFFLACYNPNNLFFAEKTQIESKKGSDEKRERAVLDSFTNYQNGQSIGRSGSIARLKNHIVTDNNGKLKFNISETILNENNDSYIKADSVNKKEAIRLVRNYIGCDEKFVPDSYFASFFWNKKDYDSIVSKMQ